MGMRAASSLAMTGFRLPPVTKHKSSEPGASTLQVHQLASPVWRSLNLRWPNLSAMRSPGAAGLE
jgi:hypothetical protein